MTPRKSDTIPRVLCPKCGMLAPIKGKTLGPHANVYGSPCKNRKKQPRPTT